MSSIQPSFTAHTECTKEVKELTQEDIDKVKKQIFTLANQFYNVLDAFKTLDATKQKYIDEKVAEDSVQGQQLAKDYEQAKVYMAAIRWNIVQMMDKYQGHDEIMYEFFRCQITKEPTYTSQLKILKKK